MERERERQACERTHVPRSAFERCPPFVINSVATGCMYSGGDLKDKKRPEETKDGPRVVLISFCDWSWLRF